MRSFARIAFVTAVLFMGLAPYARAQAVADLGVTKTGPAIANAGSNVPYNIALVNVGPDDAATITLNDNIPAGMTFVSATADPAFACSTPLVGSGGSVTCTAPALVAGATANFTFVFQISTDVAPGTFFVDTATVISGTLDPNSENDSSTATTQTPPPPSADLFVTKSAPASAAPGGNVTFSISAGNAGPDAATTVSWSDTLPGTMTFVSITQNSGPAFDCTSHPAPGAGGTVTCTIATLNAGATGTFTLVGQVPNGTLSGTTYQNTATFGSATTDPNAENNSATSLTTVAVSDLSVTKTASPAATVGGTITYVVTVANNGPDTAQNVNLQDTLPPGVTFVSVTQDTGAAASCTGGGNSVGCSLGTMLNGTSSQFTIVASVGSAAAGSTATNTASVSSDSFDSNLANNSASASTVVAPSADLSIVKTAPATVAAGANMTYSITLANAGPSAATAVVFNDALPAGTTFQSIGQTGSPVFTCTTPAVGTNGPVNCTAATMASGANVNVSLVVNVPTAAAGTLISNTGTVSSATGDPIVANNSSTASTTVGPSADVSISKSSAATAVAGTNLPYTITVTNNGPSPASSVIWTDTLPANTTFVSLTPVSGPAFACTTPAVGGIGTVTCNAATLAPATSSVFTLVVQTASSLAAGPLANTATVTATSPDPTPANNSSTATTTISSSADLGVTKTGPVNAPNNGDMTYTVTLTNLGPSDASAVSLTDTVPVNTTFVSATPSAPFTCTTPAVGGTGTITCTAPSFVSGGSATFSIVVHVLNSVAAGTVITNTASVTAATLDANPANNSASFTTTTVNAIPALSPLTLVLLGLGLAFVAIVALRGN